MTREYVRVCRLRDTLSHTRYHLVLRTTTSPVVYHRLLLFRIARPPFSPGSLDKGKWRAPELYCMEETCPHLGAPLSHAEIEDMEDTMAIVCPWHQYDFDLKNGSSSTGLNACTYGVIVKGEEADAEVWVEAPHISEPRGDQTHLGSRWEVVELRGVSEGEGPNVGLEFADPPLVGKSLASFDNLSISDTIRDSRGAAPTLPTDLPNTLLGFAHLILRTSNPDLKCALTREATSQLRSGQLKSIRPTRADIKRERDLEGGLLDVPPREVEAVQPGIVPKRGRGGTEKSRILMLHALANIEQYAIDLAWDIIARFADVEVQGERLPVEFFLDWAKVAEDEAKHYTLLAKRLRELGSYFGAHTVHAGLWDSAVQTAHSLSARIAIIHLVAEARGIDMNPLTMAKLQSAGDAESTRVLEIIHADEITHVTTGHRWFTWLCQKQDVDPIETFRQEVADNFYGRIKGPFNTTDRLKAGLTPAFYEDLSGRLGKSEQALSKEAVDKAEGDEHVHPRLT